MLLYNLIYLEKNHAGKSCCNNSCNSEQFYCTQQQVKFPTICYIIIENLHEDSQIYPENNQTLQYVIFAIKMYLIIMVNMLFIFVHMFLKYVYIFYFLLNQLLNNLNIIIFLSIYFFHYQEYFYFVLDFVLHFPTLLIL